MDHSHPLTKRLNNMEKTLRLPKINLSVKLMLILFSAAFFGSFVSEDLKSIAYAFSLTLKGLLLFVLPAIIFSCLFSCLLAFRGAKAVGFMLLLFFIVCLSNYLSTLIAYGVGSLNLIHLEAVSSTALHQSNELLPKWNVKFPSWLPYDHALYLGFGFGALFSCFPNATAYRVSETSKRFVTFFLKKGFIPLLPLFTLGFILKMQHEGALTQIIQSYVPLLLVITVTYVCYLILVFALVANFKLNRLAEYLKNVMPVALMSMSTMSSLATMPVTLAAAETNTKNSDLARAVIPATVNIHMVGGSIAIPIMALSILIGFGREFPNLIDYCWFALHFVLMQFTIAAVPGGSILVMLPLLESHFAFTSEMSVLITTLYILFNPIITMTNALGNSALVIMVNKFFKQFNTIAQTTTEDTQIGSAVHDDLTSVSS